MSKKLEKSWLSSTFEMTCPACRKGRLFETGTFSFSKPFEMYDRCPNCNQNYSPEPGFYYGAMFISYVIWAFFSLGLCLSLVFYFKWSVNSAFALLIFISMIAFVWLFRFSRSLWAHAMIKYRK